MPALTSTLPGVWFWESPHPNWERGDDWEPRVRSWVILTPAGLVLVDPLIREDLYGPVAWEPLDALIQQRGLVAAVLRLLHYHHRSAGQVSARYDVPIHARPLPREDIPVHPCDVPTGDGEELLGGLITHHVDRDDELVLEIPSVRALLFADVGRRTAGRFELCPEGWVHPPDGWAQLRGKLEVLSREREIDQLLVSHGDHQLGEDGRTLAAAVARAAARPLPPFIALDDLAQRRRSWKLIDARLYLDGRSEHDAYLAAHQPGAVFLDFAATLAAPPGEDAIHGRHPLPSPERFAAGLAGAGVSEGDTVVAYDDSGGVMAARLVWLLRSLGEEAALLSPVPENWEDRVVPDQRPGRFAPRPWPAERFAGITEVAERGPGTVLLDARDPERYAGAPDPFEPRFGHIPGAVNLPCRTNLDSAGALIPWPRLRERLSAALGDGEDVISSCGSGVTACHNLLTLEAVGVSGRLYAGSFSEWARDPARPVATGP